MVGFKSFFMNAIMVCASCIVRIFLDILGGCWNHRFCIWMQWKFGLCIIYEMYCCINGKIFPLYLICCVFFSSLDLKFHVYAQSQQQQQSKPYLLNLLLFFHCALQLRAIWIFLLLFTTRVSIFIHRPSHSSLKTFTVKVL